MRCALLGAIMAGLLAAGCGGKPSGQGQAAATTEAAGPVMKDITELSLRPYRGKVVLVELGVVGCSGTETAYNHMRTMSKKYDGSVAFIRVDHGQKIEETKDYYARNPAGFDVFGDPTEKVGNALPSQAMPTLFLYCKWGQMRYSGGLDPAAMEKMIAALLAETKPNETNFFFSKGIRAGDEAPEFTLDRLGGGKAAVSEFMKDSKAFLMVFAGTECPHSRAGTSALPGIYNEYGPDGLKVLIVNTGQAAEAVREYYEGLDTPLDVLVDADGSVARKLGLDVVPTVLLCGQDGKIAFASNWNQEAIVQEIQVMLGQLKPEDRQPVKSEGAG